MLHQLLLPNDRKNGMTAQEAWQVTRVRIAKYYGGMKPSDIEAWSWEDIQHTLQVMEGDKELAEVRAKLRAR